MGNDLYSTGDAINNLTIEEGFNNEAARIPIIDALSSAIDFGEIYKHSFLEGLAREGNGTLHNIPLSTEGVTQNIAEYLNIDKGSLEKLGLENADLTSLTILNGPENDAGNYATSVYINFGLADNKCSFKLKNGSASIVENAVGECLGDVGTVTTKDSQEILERSSATFQEMGDCFKQSPF